MSDTPDPVAEGPMVDERAAVANDPVVDARPVVDEPAAMGKVPDPLTVQSVKRRGTVLPMVLGGILAAIIGFGLAQVVPHGWPLAEVSGLSTELATQKATIAKLQSQLADVAKVPAPKIDTGLQDRVAAVETALAALATPADVSGRLEAVEKRVAALSALPAGSGSVDGTAVAQLQGEIDALKSGGSALDAKVAEAAGKLDTIKAEAQAVVTQAAARAALHQLQVALDSGAPYGSAMGDLAGVTLPEVLTSHADTGLPSLQGLRADFPAAARAALDASLQATSGDSWTDRLGTFLRGQTGARSLTPRSGSDPDAVLSRAEAAVVAGDINAALTELAALPDAGKAAMADWLKQAQLRQDAVAAVQALIASSGQ